MLSVDISRVWHRPGLLLIGDAAHAMSPVGGVGINLAVADAVAAARLLAPSLRSSGSVTPAALRRVQARRLWPTVVIQSLQRVAHKLILGRALGFDPDAEPAATPSLPPPARLLERFPALRGIPARLVGIGPLPEHAPQWARRPGTVHAHHAHR